MYTHANKTEENKSNTFANNLSKQQSKSVPAFQLVDSRPEANAQRKLQEMANNSHQVSKLSAFQNMASSRASSVTQFKPVIQRISEEDMVQANIRIRGSAERHGYSAEQLERIIRHRFNEINPGRQQHLLLGSGADENNQNLGSIIYDCNIQGDGTYYIEAFHAHGGQTEGGNRRGY